VHKAIREAYLPLADYPEIQKETMKKLGIDGRTPEQKWIDEMNEEKKEPVIMLNLNSGQVGPDVNIMIDTRKVLKPKQDVSKPEKSIVLMQQKGMLQKPKK
jgi:hypothetical protein